MVDARARVPEHARLCDSQAAARSMLQIRHDSASLYGGKTTSLLAPDDVFTFRGGRLM